MTKEHFIQSRADLETYITLTNEEKIWFDSLKGDSLPLRITHYFASLIDPFDLLDPIRRQVVPSYKELQSHGQESEDPLCELEHSQTPRLIHRYSNRVALLVSDHCATYCRHCFRRRFTAKKDAIISWDELEVVGEYLEKNQHIKEMLLTGGDPLMVNDDRLLSIITSIRKRRSDIVLRLCTRVLATYPARITQHLIDMLKNFSTAPIYVMSQFNHPRELTKESIQAISFFVENGFPVMNQTVLLKGVNDDVDTLEELMNALVMIKVKPYYLFQGDMVEGTSHLRLPLLDAMEIEKALRMRLSGLAMPTVAVDLPFGGGKVPLSGTYYKGQKNEKTHIYMNLYGKEIEYIDP